MTEQKLFLNGYEVEIPVTGISLNLQINDLGKLEDRQSDFTPRFSLDLTPKNVKALEFLGITGDGSTVPYRNISAKWVVNGIELISDGFAVVNAVNEMGVLKNYEVYIYNNNIDVFKAIEGKSIRDLDFTDINHKATYIHMIQTFNGTLDYIYGIAGFTGKIPVANNFNLKYMIPSMYEHAIFRRIWEEAGFTYTGDIFATDEFKSYVIGAVGTDPNQTDLLVKDFSKIVPDIEQKQFIKEILWRYGLIFQRKRNTTEYEFRHMKDVLTDRPNAVDYSDKFKSISKHSFRLGQYAKRNWLRFSQSDNGSTVHDGSIDVDIQNLEGSRDALVSRYQIYPVANVFNYVEPQVFEIDTENSEIKINEVKPWISKVKYISDSQQYKDENGTLQTYGGDKPYLQFFDMSFRRQIYFYYREVREVISRARVYELTMYFTPIDIYKIDFLKPIYIKQLSSYFYINKVKAYKPGTPTKVEVVRIPETVLEFEPDTTAPVVSLTVDDDTVTQGHESVFTLSVTEENVDTWKLEFGYGGYQVSGVGQPPSTVPHTYPVGSYTATLTVTDFEGNEGSDTADVTVSAVDDVQIDPVNGEITAPPGVTMTFRLSISGAGELSGFAGVAETFGGPNTLASGQVDNVAGGSWPSTYETTFVMPGSGSAFLTGSCSPTGGGSTGGALIIEIKLLNESEFVLVNLNETYP